MSLLLRIAEVQPAQRIGGSTSGLDSFIQYTFGAPGIYIIGVGEYNSFDSGGQIGGNTPDSGDTYTLQVSLEGKGFIPPPPDVYSFDLQAGESTTVVVTALSSGNVSVELQDSLGATVASGSALSNFVASATGTYYAVVNGDQSVDYSLLVARNADFDSESNDDLASAQKVLSTKVAGRQWVLGQVERVSPNLIENGSFETGDFTGWTVTTTGGPFRPWQVTGAGFGDGFNLSRTSPFVRTPFP